MQKYKNALGLIVVFAILMGIFCANEADAGGRGNPPPPPVVS